MTKKMKNHAYCMPRVNNLSRSEKLTFRGCQLSLIVLKDLIIFKESTLYKT